MSGLQVSLVLWEKPSAPTLLVQAPQSHGWVQVRGWAAKGASRMLEPFIPF